MKEAAERGNKTNSKINGWMWPTDLLSNGQRGPISGIILLVDGSSRDIPNVVDEDRATLKERGEGEGQPPHAVNNLGGVYGK